MIRLLLVLAVMVAADSPAVQAYREAEQRARAARVLELNTAITAKTEKLQRVRRQRDTAKSRALIAELKKLRGELGKVEDGTKSIAPRLNADELAAGQAGVFDRPWKDDGEVSETSPRPLKILRILGRERMLVETYYYVQSPGRRPAFNAPGRRISRQVRLGPYLVTGLSTADLVDGDELDAKQPYWIRAPERLDDGRTVHVLEAIRFDR